MTQPVDIEALRQLMERATAGPWDIWREPIKDIQDAIDEAMVQVQATDPIIDAMVMLNAGGKCPAMTGCGPTSDANAELIVALRNNAEALLTELEALRAERGRMAEGHREAVARCIQIIFETRDGFLSPEYATDQPISSVMERFACDRCIDAISSEFAMGSNEQRQLVGRPTHLEEYRATLKEPSQ
jgi:hypothetical protein